LKGRYVSLKPHNNRINSSDISCNVFLATWLIRYPLKIAIPVGSGFAQMGEFSPVIVKMGWQYNLINEHFFSVSIMASLLTMLTTLFMLIKSPVLID